MYRMMLSRLYYAAHHLGRRLLRNVGLHPQRWRQNVHVRVIQEVQRHFVTPGTMSAASLHTLWRLRRLRVRADYQLAVAITDQEMNEAVALFRTYLHDCARLLGVS
jgi:uncharacterized protein (UPF0332 family)